MISPRTSTSLLRWPVGPAQQDEARLPGEEAEAPAPEAPPEVRTLLQDLHAFQREEMQALQSYLSLLFQRASRDELLVACEVHAAARARTRQCLMRVHQWRHDAYPA